VSMKIVGLDLSGAGITSLDEALDILAFYCIRYPHIEGKYRELTNGNYKSTDMDEYGGGLDVLPARFFQSSIMAI
jgi:hypothetical protein